MSLFTLPASIWLIFAQGILLAVGARRVEPVHARAGRYLVWTAAVGLVVSLLLLLGDALTMGLVMLGSSDALTWMMVGMTVAGLLSPLATTASVVAGGYALVALSGRIRGTPMDEREREHGAFG